MKWLVFIVVIMFLVGGCLAWLDVWEPGFGFVAAIAFWAFALAVALTAAYTAGSRR